jgi:hypothetical protein
MSYIKLKNFNTLSPIGINIWHAVHVFPNIEL